MTIPYVIGCVCCDVRSFVPSWQSSGLDQGDPVDRNLRCHCFLKCLSFVDRELRHRCCQTFRRCSSLCRRSSSVSRGRAMIPIRRPNSQFGRHVSGIGSHYAWIGGRVPQSGCCVALVGCCGALSGCCGPPHSCRGIRRRARSPVFPASRRLRAPYAGARDGTFRAEDLCCAADLPTREDGP